MHKIHSDNNISVRVRDAIVDKKLTTTDITASGMVSANSMVTNFIDATDIYTTDYLGQRVKLLASNSYAVPVDLSINSINLFNAYDPTSAVNMDYNDITLSNENSQVKLTADGLYLGNNFIDENRILLWESKLDYTIDHPANLFNIYSGNKKLMFNIDGIKDGTNNFKFQYYPLSGWDSYRTDWNFEPLRVCNLPDGRDAIITKNLEIDAYSNTLMLGKYSNQNNSSITQGTIYQGFLNIFEGPTGNISIIGNQNRFKPTGVYNEKSLGYAESSIIIGDSNTIHDKKNIVIGNSYTVEGNTTCIGYPETTKCFMSGIRNKSYDYTIPDVNGVCIDTITNQLGIYDRNKFKNEINIYGDDTSLCKITGGKISLFNAGGNNAIHIEPTIITIDNEVITKDRIIKWDNFADTAVSNFSDTIFRISNDTHVNQLKFDLSLLTDTTKDYKDYKIICPKMPDFTYTTFINKKIHYTLPTLVTSFNTPTNKDYVMLSIGNEIEKPIRIDANMVNIGIINTTSLTTSTAYDGNHGIVVGNQNTFDTQGTSYNITMGFANKNIGTSIRNIILGSYNSITNDNDVVIIGNRNSQNLALSKKCYILGINGNTDQLATGVGIDPTSHQLKVYNRHLFNGPITVENTTLSGVELNNLKNNYTNMKVLWADFDQAMALNKTLVIPEPKNFLISFANYSNVYSVNQSLYFRFCIKASDKPVGYDLYYSIRNVYMHQPINLDQIFETTNGRPLYFTVDGVGYYKYEFRIKNQAYQDINFDRIAIYMKAELIIQDNTSVDYPMV